MIIKKLLNDPEFKKDYDDLQEECALLNQIIKKRIKTGMTQKDLAKKMSIQQSVISRMENGGYSPSFQCQIILAEAFEYKSKIEFI